MANGDPATSVPRYDRNFLLSPAKRNQIVELWEVEKFGRDSFGDPDAVALYGMRPAEWYAKGVRILARTTLEAVRDPLGNRIGADVARVAAMTPQGTLFGVVDLLRRVVQRPLFDPAKPPKRRGNRIRVRAGDLRDEHAQHCLARRTHPPVQR